MIAILCFLFLQIDMELTDENSSSSVELISEELETISCKREPNNENVTLSSISVG